MDRDSSARTGGGVIVGVLAAWTLFELLSGGKIWHGFSTGGLDQHVLLGHVIFGFLVMLPAVLAAGRAATAGRRQHGRLVEGLLGLAVLSAGASGCWLFVKGSSVMPTLGRDSHLVTGIGCVLLLTLVAIGPRGQNLRLAGARSGLAWIVPVVALAVPFGTVGVTLSVWPEESMEIPFPEKYFRPSGPFLPARTLTSHGGAVKIEALANSHRCGKCHTGIYEQWKSSLHRQSTVSKWYQAGLKARMETAMASGPAGARFCGACHEPIVTLSGNMDKRGLGPQYPPNLDQGISCTHCHRMTGIRDTYGNGSYIYSAHRPYLFENSDSPLLASLGRGLLRSKPDVHARDLMQPFYSTSESCATCHQIFMKTMYGKLFEIQNDYNSWKASSYSKDGPNKAMKNCQHCHMPLVEAEDPASIGGKVHSHRFVGANTAVPFQENNPDQLARTEEFLKQACYLNVQGPENIDAGEEAEFQVVVTNANVGHSFPGGATDMVNAWIEAIATDGDGNQIFASGLVDPDTLYVDPESHQYRTYPIDIYGKHLFTRAVWNIHEVTESRLIQPNESDVARFRVPITPGTKGPIEFRARLRFRRSSQRFTDAVFPNTKMVLPITDMASDSLQVSLGPGDEPGASSTTQGDAN